jgi:TolB-like protein/DNA-binding winged helix-turn-helix (wHTH) protein/Tfp pilus assembly protein PilF
MSHDNRQQRVRVHDWAAVYCTEGPSKQHMLKTKEQITPMTTPSAFRLGEWLVDPALDEVSRNGEVIRLEPRTMELLVRLAQSPGQVISSQQLLDTVWSGVIVGPASVYQAISQLRKVLGDTDSLPTYIATIPRKGYRLVAPVTGMTATVSYQAAPTSTPAESVAAFPVDPQPAQPRARPRLLWTSLVILVLGAIGIGVWREEHQSIVPAMTLPARSVAVLPFDNLGESPQDAALAFGVAEALLHQLSGSKDLTVIARKSSFAFVPRETDAREIGRKLNARYLVEGSLQSTSARLRITAQLVDASTGNHVWSLQFDRKPEDIFAIQDEIAGKVVEAMQLSVLEGALAPVQTHDFDAYLAYAQGRVRLASGRASDIRLSIADFERAIKIDPEFVDAYVSLSSAHSWAVQMDASDEQGQNRAKAREISRELIERALELDETNADAHVELGMLLWRGERAEAAIRRAIELTPRSAASYANLAHWYMSHEFEPDPAIKAMDRARQLDPLGSQYDAYKSMLLLYGKSDTKQAEAIALKVLERDPTSAVALRCLGEIHWVARGQYARGAQYLEQALASNPDDEFTRRNLMRMYLDMGDPDEAEALANSAPHPVSVRTVMLLTYQRDWRAAAETIYEQEKHGTESPIEGDMRVFSLRMGARSAADFAAARRYLETQSEVTWDANGSPQLRTVWGPPYSIGLADILMRSGEKERGEKLLHAILARYDYESHTLGRGDLWYMRDLPVAMMLLGRDEDALAMLERAVASGLGANALFYLDIDPALDRLRQQPRFQALVAQGRRIQVEQRKELERIRSAGLIRHRTRR